MSRERAVPWAHAEVVAKSPNSRAPNRIVRRIELLPNQSKTARCGGRMRILHPTPPARSNLFSGAVLPQLHPANARPTRLQYARSGLVAYDDHLAHGHRMGPCTARAIRVPGIDLDPEQ